MAKTGVKLSIHPEILGKLSSGKRELWHAAHNDGSDNRINGEAVMETASYSTTLGIFSAIFQGIRKAFRNRGKTEDDFVAEKEAREINQTCDALDLMLRDYLKETQEGILAEETMDDVMDTLKDAEVYARAGKLTISGKKEAADILGSIGDFTAALIGETAGKPFDSSALQSNPFSQILDLLSRQKEWLRKSGMK